jgi:multiple antibiotic resistance protein
MAEVLNAFLYVFAALFPVINPPGSGLIFLGITWHTTAAARELIARRIALYAFVLLVLSLFVGTYVLKIFGISVPVLRVAGGCVVAAMGWRLLHSTDGNRENVGEAEIPLKDLEQQAFYPFTMPLTAGPGSIAVTVALGASGPRMDGSGYFFMFSIGAILATACICAAIYACYAYAYRIQKLIGETGIGITMRLSAFILLCIGVQIIWGGVQELWSGTALSQ